MPGAKSETRYVVGLDAGTQSTKVGVWDLGGKAVSRASSPIPVSTPREGWAEQEPGQWWSSACSAIRQACSGIDSARVEALGVAYQRETFTITRRDGAPLRPAMLWLDIRAHEEVAELEASLGRDWYQAHTGKPLDVTSALPRLLWLRKHEPGLLTPMVRWTDVGSFLFEKLTGRWVSCRAGTDTAGMIGLETGAWNAQMLEAAGLTAEQVPALAGPAEVVGTLTGEAAAQTGLRQGLTVVAAGGDGQVFQAAVLGASPGEPCCSLTLGTSVVLGLPSAEATISPFFRTLLAALPGGGHVLESVIQSGTYLLGWFAERFALPPARSLEDWEREAGTVEPGSGGLVTVPTWWGTRFPRPFPEARGVTAGWSHHHTLAHFYRSLLEGVALELGSLLLEIGARWPRIRPSRVVVGGGGARSRLWLEIIRDVLGLELCLAEEPEPVACGAAMLAACGCGALGGVKEAAGRFVRLSAAESPDAARHGRYAALLREVYLPLRNGTAELSAGLRGRSDAGEGGR